MRISERIMTINTRSLESKIKSKGGICKYVQEFEYILFSHIDDTHRRTSLLLSLLSLLLNLFQVVHCEAFLKVGETGRSVLSMLSVRQTEVKGRHSVRHPRSQMDAV